MNSNLLILRDKTIIKIAIIFCMILFSFIHTSNNVYTNNIAYAAEEQKPCTACSRTSPYLDKYIQFSNEIVYTLEVFSNQEQSVFNAWSSNDTNEKSDLLRKLMAITDNLNTKRQMAANTTYITFLTSTEMFENAGLSTAVLASSDSLYRDWNKLEDAWQRLVNVASDLWNAGVFVRIGLREWRQARIQNTLAKYSTGSNPLFIYNERNSATTQPVILFTDLRSITQKIKTSLYFGTSLNDKDLKETYMWGAISLSPEFLEEMKEYYKCVRWPKWSMTCSNEKLQKIASNRYDEIAQSAKKDTEYAMQTFKTAWKRLSGFRSSNAETKEALKNRQYELLRWQYWRRAANPWIVKQVVHWWNTAVSTIKSTYTKATNIIEGITIRPPKRETTILIGDQQTIAMMEKEREDMIAVGTTIAKTAKQVRDESEYSNPTYVTKLFPILTQNVVMQRILIDGNGDKKTIYANLWTACENQCTNVPGKKCYYEIK